MKKIVGHDVLPSYPNSSERFITHTDASKTQLMGIISKNGKPIAFYSWKLTPAQINYTAIEQKLLSIVENLKYFCILILGHRITLYRDNNNLTYEKFTTERVLQWSLLMEKGVPI